MDRLTKRNADGSVSLDLPVNQGVFFPERSIRKSVLQEILERLADYEDAEEQGLIIRSQCSLWERDVAPVNRWIPVDERLPEPGAIVLVCGKKGGMRVARAFYTALTSKPLWTVVGTGKCFNATHWMELPGGAES